MGEEAALDAGAVRHLLPFRSAVAPVPRSLLSLLPRPAEPFATPRSPCLLPADPTRSGRSRRLRPAAPRLLAHPACFPRTQPDQIKESCTSLAAICPGPGPEQFELPYQARWTHRVRGEASALRRRGAAASAARRSPGTRGPGGAACAVPSPTCRRVEWSKRASRATQWRRSRPRRWPSKPLRLPWQQPARQAPVPRRARGGATWLSTTSTGCGAARSTPRCTGRAPARAPQQRGCDWRGTPRQGSQAPRSGLATAVRRALARRFSKATGRKRAINCVRRERAERSSRSTGPRGARIAALLPPTQSGRRTVGPHLRRPPQATGGS